MSDLNRSCLFVEALEGRTLLSQTVSSVALAPQHVDVGVVAAKATASVMGKWRTKGTIDYSGNGTTVLSGDGPVWINFRTGGRLLTEMGLPLLWKQSGQTISLSLDQAEAKAQLGGRSISGISYRKRTGTITGSTIRGSFDCSFTVAVGGTSVRARLVWAFSGKRW